MTKRKIFPAILYFLFTFLIGIFLALFLTPIYLYGTDLLLDEFGTSLKNGEYVDAMYLVGGYFDKECVGVYDVDGGGKFIMFKAATLVDEERNVSEEETETLTKLQKSYVGFLYGTKENYHTNSTENNKTAVYITTNGAEKSQPILDTDDNDDGKLDYILFYETKDFVFLELNEAEYDTIEKIRFVDKDGNDFYTLTFDTALDFSSGFFEDIDELVDIYNKAVEKDELSDEENLAVTNTESAFLEKSDNYLRSSYDKPEARAQKKATKTIIIYFVVVYVIADMLFTHFIIKFIKFMLFSVFKIKPKERAMKVHNDSFGNDYYCAVTLKLVKDEGTNCVDDITVTYGEGDKKAIFVLTAVDGYEKYVRIKAGTYEGVSVETASQDYKVEYLPEALIADGYKKTITAKIVRRED